ncbi:uncharacterized protein [Euphorbia lathyris]|uniref:uncharacterized protein n=1 Tax=Euphorbia lathyris TaxID=212925 RepID=UPI0033142896
MALEQIHYLKQYGSYSTPWQQDKYQGSNSEIELERSIDALREILSTMEGSLAHNEAFCQSLQTHISKFIEEEAQAITLRSGTQVNAPDLVPQQDEVSNPTPGNITSIPFAPQVSASDPNLIADTVVQPTQVTLPYATSRRAKLDKDYSKMKLGMGDLKPTSVTIQLADRSIRHPVGVVEDLLVKVDQFIFPADFVIMDIEEDDQVPILLGRPFLATGRTLIDVEGGKLILRLQNEEVEFNILKSMKFPIDDECCNFLSLTDSLVENAFQEIKGKNLNIELEEEEPSDLEIEAEGKEGCNWARHDELLDKETKTRPKTSIEEPPTLDLKPLPAHLKYMFLAPPVHLPIIIFVELTGPEEDRLVEVLRKHKGAFRWQMSNIKGISPSLYEHRIYMEDKVKPTAQPQRRLNPKMKEVVKAEVIRLLDAVMIYPIFDSQWASLVHMVPKKGGTTVTLNEKNELIPVRKTTGWRMCMDYRKLNDATRKDHFPLPFIDQMLERMADFVKKNRNSCQTARCRKK